MKKHEEIRQLFINFFLERGHKYHKPSPILNTEDPTLMFTNSGMNQFKDYLLGNKISGNTRLVNSQRCLRVSGKHNDLEDVGLDTYHHTMFEMLGNWSFGDYFKEDSIKWTWEFLTEICGIDKERLYVSVFSGDQKP